MLLKNARIKEWHVGVGSTHCQLGKTLSPRDVSLSVVWKDRSRKIPALEMAPFPYQRILRMWLSRALEWTHAFIALYFLRAVCPAVWRPTTQTFPQKKWTITWKCVLEQTLSHLSYFCSSIFFPPQKEIKTRVVNIRKKFKGIDHFRTILTVW